MEEIQQNWPPKVFRKLSDIQSKMNLKSIHFKPKQIICWDHLLAGKDVIAVLPTGYGKSLIYQLLPYLFPSTKNNIIIVISPLNSIIEDQIKSLKFIGIEAGTIKIQDPLHLNPKLLVGEDDDDTQKTITVFSDRVMNGLAPIVFCHPEAALSEEGRKLWRRKVYQKNVVALVVDEVHCVHEWGQEFRKEFKNLSALRSLFPLQPLLALTATITSKTISQISKDLCISNYRLVIENPDRPNIFLSRNMRLDTIYGKEGYRKILTPIAEQLKAQKTDYPLTIIYMKLQYCAFAYNLFESILREDQFINENKVPKNRLFAQFHAPQTGRMKEEILSEITSENSNIRVLFCTTALGMGVNAPMIKSIIHCNPPSTIETYMQQIGRAGRQQGLTGEATLYYANSDISTKNLEKGHIDKDMIEYCKSEDCLRSTLLEHFGYEKRQLERCCSMCQPIFQRESNQVSNEVCRKVNDLDVLTRSFNLILADYDEEDHDPLFFMDTDDLSSRLMNVLDHIEELKSKDDLLHIYGIWDENVMSNVYDVIKQNTTETI